MRWSGLLSSFLLVSCASTQPRTEVVVRIEAEPGVAAEATSLHVVVRAGPNRTEDSLATRSDRTYPESGALSFPYELALVPADGDASRVFEVTVEARRGSATFATARVVSGYVARQTLLVSLHIEDACRDLPACDPGNTCHQARCVDAFVPPTDLVPYVSLDMDGGTTADDDTGTDAGTDATLPDDTGLDAADDDTGLDAAPDDTGMDAGNDAGNDAGSDASTDAGVDAALRATPLQITPPSLSNVSNNRPPLRWQLGSGSDGVQVDFCTQSNCGTVLHSMTVGGSATSATPDIDLPRGNVFWRLHSMHGASVDGATSPTWLMHIPRNTPGLNTWSGGPFDGNLDGLADAVIAWERTTTTDGEVAGFRGGSSGVETTSHFRFVETLPRFGHTVASAGDLNGDGYGDIVVGYQGNGGPGGLDFYFGSAAWTLAASPSTSYADSDTGAQFSVGLTSLGDIDRDGFGDIAVGAPRRNSQHGRVYVFHGSAAGLRVPPSPIDPPDSGLSEFGHALASGDFNGDGYADLVVGAPVAGHVFVFHGGASGLATSPSLTLSETATQYGSSLTAVDFDADGFTDLAVGTPFGGGAAGAVFVYRGNGGGLTGPQQSLVAPDGSGSSFGVALGSADVNGDGYPDLIVGADGVSSYAGRVYVYLGGNIGVTATVWSTITGSAASIHLGSRVSGVGDVNGDGFDDVAACTTNDAFIYAGSASGLVPTPILSPAPSSAGYASVLGR